MAAAQLCEGSKVIDVLDIAEPAPVPDADTEILKLFLKGFRDQVLDEPSAGTFGLCFLLSASGLARHHRFDLARRTIEEIAQIVEEKRPMPALLWAKLIARHCDNPRAIEAFCQRVLRELHELPRAITKVAYEQWKSVGVPAYSKVLVHGYAETIKDALRGIPNDVRPRAIVAPRAEGGTLLQEQLRDVSSTTYVDIVEGETAAARLLEGDIDLLMIGAKTIGMHRGQLSVVTMQSNHDYIGKAIARKVPIVVVTGSYKIWPCDLFAEVAVPFAAKHQPIADYVIPADKVKVFLTEHGMHTCSQFQHQYSSQLNTTMEKYSGWKETRGGSDDLGYEETKFAVLLENEGWYDEHAGEYVAIAGDEVHTDKTLTQLADRMNERYPDRSVLIALVTREPAMIGSLS
jgi:uncharacterized protein DUF5678